jgi:hypothetical protein
MRLPIFQYVKIAAFATAEDAVAAICRFHFVVLKNDKRHKQKILV